jgi:hypothetical protein
MRYQHSMAIIYQHEVHIDKLSINWFDNNKAVFCIATYVTHVNIDASKDSHWDIAHLWSSEWRNSLIIGIFKITPK